QEVEIERPGRVRLASNAPEPPLDGEQLTHQAAERQSRADCDRGVDVVRLWRSADRAGLPQRRAGLDLDVGERSDGLDGRFDGAPAVAEVCAEADDDEGVGHGVST